jgi:hypothetical protein
MNNTQLFLLDFVRASEATPYGNRLPIEFHYKDYGCIVLFSMIDNEESYVFICAHLHLSE